MYFKEECMGVQCDNCGKVYEDLSGYVVWPDKENLQPEERGWYVEPFEDKHYCTECHLINGEDVLVLKHIAPIYEVIAEFPNNKDFPIGKKITFERWNTIYWQHKVSDCQGERTWLSEYFERMPYLFRKVWK